MNQFEAQCELEALKIEAMAAVALGEHNFDIRDRLCEIASGMRSLPEETSKEHSFPVDLAFIELPSPVAESVTVLTVSGVSKWVVEQKRRVRLVVEE